MSSKNTGEKSTTRRNFFQGVTSGAAGLAIASALTQLGDQ